MSREIKFRAWDKKKKQMFYSDDKSKKDQFVFVIFSDGEWRLGEVDYDWSIRGSGNNGYYGDGELMQYTGLKDKNGKEIYESDILKVIEEDDPFESEAKVYEVVWGDKYPAFTLAVYEDIEYNSLQHACFVAQCEVAGNIYETPELLNQKQST